MHMVLLASDKVILAAFFILCRLMMNSVDCQTRLLLSNSKMQHASLSLSVDNALLSAKDGIISGHIDMKDKLSFHGKTINVES